MPSLERVERVVLDTNVVVSALWSPDGKPADILAMIPAEIIQPFVNHTILAEYRCVLMRPRLRFSGTITRQILALFDDHAIMMTAPPSAIEMPDPDDRVFYDVACAADAWLITGNKRHFPQEDHIVSPAEFLEQYRA
ncbi:MAG: putative toxin-antitoxin system toxin component, PIN family [Coriobacteriia bacterium]|nr:putative toxin-antitoxin system toxin component, PIN family [Coriobacteriia bacterium]